MSISAAVNNRVRQLRERELKLRAANFNGPDYFAGSLLLLEEHHELIAREVTAIEDEHGWPGSLWLGEKGSQEFCELVSSCWSVPTFMLSSLKSMETGYRSGDILGVYFAMFYDTLMFLENKPQVYGMHLHWDSAGRLVPWTIVNPEGVERRRLAIGLDVPVSLHVERSRAQAVAFGIVPPANVERHDRCFREWAVGRGWPRI